MTPVPEISDADMTFGNVSHLPARDSLPEEFNRGWRNQKPHCEFVSGWFFEGLKPEDLARLKPKDGVDRDRALRAIGAILRSFQPQHEHKIGGCGFLLSEWFHVSEKELAA